MKTTQNNRNAVSPNDDGRLLPEALKSVMAYVAVLFIFLLLAILCGCRSHKMETSTAVSMETATVFDGSSDSLRTHSSAQSVSSEIAATSEREQTNIHIKRDSAGRPTDIQINSSKTGNSRKDSASSAAAVSESTAKHDEKAVCSTSSDAREVKPVKTEDHSTARTMVAVVFFALFAFLGIGLFRGLKK